MSDDDGDKPDPEIMPEQIPVRVDDSVTLVAHRAGPDRTGVMRYKMKYDTAQPVQCSAVQYRHNEIGLIFDSPVGKIAFDFKLREKGT